MAYISTWRPARRIKFPLMLAALAIAFIARPAFASTYAAYIPLDSSIYDELATLNDLGLADSYLSEIQPISRVEAASKLSEMQSQNQLARSVIGELRLQLPDEVQWIEQDHEDNLPTMFHPLDRVEGEYVLSEGKRRSLDTSDRPGNTNGGGIDFQEGTPLLPNNDYLSTDQGSNEILRWSGWGGVGGFVTGYGEGALAGPVTDSPRQANRAELLTGEIGR